MKINNYTSKMFNIDYKNTSELHEKLKNVN